MSGYHGGQHRQVHQVRGKEHPGQVLGHEQVDQVQQAEAACGS